MMADTLPETEAKIFGETLALVDTPTDKLPEAGIKTLGNVLVDAKLDALVYTLVFTKVEAKAQTLGDKADTLAEVEAKTLSDALVDV